MSRKHGAPGARNQSPLLRIDLVENNLAHSTAGYRHAMTLSGKKPKTFAEIKKIFNCGMIKYGNIAA